MVQSKSSTHPHSPTPARGVGRLALRLVVLLSVLAGLLFLPAGRLDWLEAWVFIFSYGAFLSAYAVWGVRNDPGQLAERSRMAPNVKSWDKRINALYTALLLITLVLIGFDAGRYAWSSVPPAPKAAGWLGYVLGGALISWSAVTNTYLSRMARIQHDRGQTVVSRGPYRRVRHPMYLGIILLFLSLPPALGSFLGLIPASLIGALFLLRTHKEDTMLKEELPGYAEYTQRVRYRILPGVW